ncbi:50S ribosomal protein L11 methyltransferase [Ciceribacter naphthalenivorans]|uniref:50S ribosomal protein L11 methyltransferase n=2 Tax=Alphaproteobacteria TaxID=28211 RepID=A0A512HJW7_9HYPH|nr:methyltransferase [Sphingomonas psychrolutea]GEO85734.1 50S ribosomal protein L11 methyltransferase [Ciceribacter naphthalenivorans]GLR21906.1 50S ribosomal protein L11 methyltransferase [Ciceribacter naphthalenivorans]GLT04762.1 50S ribosomal protein L11 methyltransferase [Sphingomonas psychrolutea]
MNTDPEAFIRKNTSLMAPPHVPEIRLRLASEVHDLWLKTEEDLDAIGLPPPFWAFAWAGGQGLARYVLDHPEEVRGKRVLDFATGSGLVAIAAKLAGAAEVIAVDIDPWAGTAVRLNAAENGVEIEFLSDNLIGVPIDTNIILAGDVFYDRDFSDALAEWFGRLTAAGTRVLAGDPGRSYRPTERLEPLATYEVPVTRVLEDSEIKKTTVWLFR